MFVFSPFPLAKWQLDLYHLAYEKAQLDLAPPKHYRMFCASLN
jgi:hypothetical protein